MKLVKFIDNRFQELRVQEQAENEGKEYSIMRVSEVLALQSLLKANRVTLKWLLIPKVILHYLMVILGAAKAPRPVLVEKMKAEQKKKEKTHLASVSHVEKK